MSLIRARNRREARHAEQKKALDTSYEARLERLKSELLRPTASEFIDGLKSLSPDKQQLHEQKGKYTRHPFSEIDIDSDEDGGDEDR